MFSMNADTHIHGQKISTVCTLNSLSMLSFQMSVTPFFCSLCQSSDPTQQSLFNSSVNALSDSIRLWIFEKYSSKKKKLCKMSERSEKNLVGGRGEGGEWGQIWRVLTRTRGKEGAETERAQRTMGAYSLSILVRQKTQREPCVVNHPSCSLVSELITNSQDTHSMSGINFSQLKCQTLLHGCC